jgi:hypothetical protein
LKEYKDYAKILKRDDFDRYWLYIYETLSWSDLTDNYKIMKNYKIKMPVHSVMNGHN